MSLKDYEILSKVGEGAYSLVFQVKRLSDQKLYALKKVKLNKLKEKEKRNALNEVRFLASINHSNVISYKEAFFDDESQCLCLVMEFADGGDLYQRIHQYQRKGTYMSETFIWSLVIQLAKGLKCLHDLNIVHRDLKSANVFLTTTGRAKLGDMNVSKVAKGCLEHTQTGTPYYASPEVWKDVPYDYRSDLWSLGCVIYEAACLKPPFRAEDMQGLYKKVVKGEYPSLPRTFSHDLHQIVAGLLQVNPLNRITCAEILSHPAVLRRINDTAETETENLLLQTINFPKKLSKITEQLPRSNFEDHSPAESRSFIKPMVDNKSLRLRDCSEPAKRSTPDRESSTNSLNYLKKCRNMIMKESYGALKLPKVKYPLQKCNGLTSGVKAPRESTVVPRVKSQKISMKPSTNRSVVATFKNIYP